MAGRRGAPSHVKLDRLVQAKCHGEAWRRALAGESIETVLAEVRAIAGSRSQVLVQVAAVGVGIGACSARPSLPATELLVAGLLFEAAGANSLDEVSRWVEIGRNQALQRPYSGV